MKIIARSLRERDFRLYFTGQSVSFVGTWVQQVALTWIAYEISGSALVLGMVAFAGQLPSLLLCPLGGLLADRISRRHILIATQLAEMSVALSLAVAAAHGVLTSSLLVGAAFATGVAVAFEMPARHAFICEVVRRPAAHLSNAIALNSMSFNAARLLGPALGGAVLALSGTSACFFANALSYLPEIYTLMTIRPLLSDRTRKASNLAAAFKYVKRNAAARGLLLTVACTSIGLAPFTTLPPKYVVDILHGDSSELGMLMGAAGCGALIAGLSIARRRSVAGMESSVEAGCVVAGLTACLFAWNTDYLFAMVLMMASGWCTVKIVTVSHAMLQMIVPNAVRGQLMAFYTMCYGGALSLASLAVGALAQWRGVAEMFVLSAVVYFLLAIALRNLLHELRAEPPSFGVAVANRQSVER